MTADNLTACENTADGTVAGDAVIAELLEQVVAAAEAGLSVDLDDLARRHPERADELRRLLPALLALDDLGLSALRSSLGGKRPTHDVPQGRELGDFRLVREIGRGGMGVVYEAEQLSLRRRVALKVLPTAAALDSRQLQRFRNEAQAAASLHHPNVVGVHGVGCERGVHYLAMQFIDGPPLSEVIARTRTEAGLEPAAIPVVSNALTKSTCSAATELTGRGRHQAAARLIRQAAEALEYAHSLGIIHRDVKPSNLLLDSRGNVWVADFGLAHLEGDTSLTLTGDVMGTLRYMSPEQATGRRGLVDHRSDVYSLGVTLYELLTFQPAFGQPHRVDLIQAVAETEPPRPRRLDASIPRDLETIVLKATAKEPAARYPTAEAFAEDLRRFLADKPVRAKRPGLVDRAYKWSRRHRAATLAVFVVLLVTTVTSGISATLIATAYEQEAEQRTAAEQAAAREKEQAEAARQAAEAALRAVGEAERQAGRAEASFALAKQAVDTMLTRAGEDQRLKAPEMEDFRRKLVGDAETFYGKLIRINPADADAYAARGDIRLYMLRDFRGALADYGKAAELAPDRPDWHAKVAVIFLHSTDPTFRNPARALPHVRRAVELAPDSGEFRTRLAVNLRALGRTAEGTAELREAARRDPAHPWTRRELANLHRAAGDLPAALREAEVSVRLDPTDHYAHAALAKIYSALGRHDEALVAVAEAERLVPSTRRGPDAYARFAAEHGEILCSAGRYQEAVAAFDRAFAVGPVRTHFYKGSAEARFRIGRYADALADIARSLELDPSDLSALTWVPPADVAACPDPRFAEGLLRLADAAAEGPHAAAAREARATLLAALGQAVEARGDSVATPAEAQRPAAP